MASTQAATAPHLRLASTLFKVDLTKRGRNLTIVARLLNEGPGRAKGVTLSGPGEDVPVSLRVIEPKPPFDVSGKSEQLVRIKAVEDTVHLIQQIGQPDWDELRDHPPYSHNAVKERDRLFGRDDMLEGLALNSMAGNSCFVWGQKAAQLRAGLALEPAPRDLIRDYLLQRVEHGTVRKGPISSPPCGRRAWRCRAKARTT